MSDNHEGLSRAELLARLRAYEQHTPGIEGELGKVVKADRSLAGTHGFMGLADAQDIGKSAIDSLRGVIQANIGEIASFLLGQPVSRVRELHPDQAKCVAQVSVYKQDLADDVDDPRIESIRFLDPVSASKSIVQVAASYYMERQKIDSRRANVVSVQTKRTVIPEVPRHVEGDPDG